MKRGFRGAAAVVITLGVAGYLYAAGIASSGYWERTVTQTNTGASSKATIKTYWKGDSKCTEQYTVDGTIAELKNGKNMYIYSPKGNTAQKFAVPDEYVVSVQKELQSMSAAAQEARKSGKKVGSAKVAGLPCDVYMVSMKGASAGHSAKIYLCTDPRFPIVLKTVATAGTQTETMETTALKLNSGVIASKLSLPKGMKVEEKKMEMPNLPKGHPPAK